MKKQFKFRTLLLILVMGLVLSCKKNESTTIESLENDTIKNTMDTVGPDVDTISLDTASTVATDTIRL